MQDVYKRRDYQYIFMLFFPKENKAILKLKTEGISYIFNDLIRITPNRFII